MAKCFHDYPRVDALNEQQGRARVAEVVESHRRQAGSLEKLVEAVRDVWTVGQSAFLAREDLVEVDPTFSSCEALYGLACTVGV